MKFSTLSLGAQIGLLIVFKNDRKTVFIISKNDRFVFGIKRLFLKGTTSFELANNEKLSCLKTIFLNDCFFSTKNFRF